jgi:predicted ArsR family transcriptional regulator
MQYTRKQITSYLRKHHSASVPELSRVLNLTVGNIRHHIRDLEDQSIIEAVGKLPIKGRGRPTNLYTLTENAVDHNLDGIVEVLLELLVKETTPGETNDRYTQIAESMTGGFQSGAANPVQLLNQVVAWLNDHHYQARWEASPSGPRVILEHCPYSTIPSKDPVLCRIDKEILSHLVGVPMEQAIKRSHTPQGTHQCVFASKTGLHPETDL